MFTELEDLTARVCENCSETYQCHTSDKDKGVCKPCHGKARRAMFAPSNDLTPTPAPPCLSDLTQVEKSAISIICPSIAIHKKGTGSASKGHTIAFFQDVETFASILPRVPDELPFIVLKDPSEKIEDRSFRVRKQKLLDALLYLKSHNEDYRHIVISRENANLYPEDDIIQSLPQLDPQEMKIPDEEPTAANDDSVREQASTVDIPGGQLSVVEKLRNGRGDMTKPRLGKSSSKKEYFKHLLNVNQAFAKHFHRTLPESEKYLGKRLVSQSDFDDLSESDKARAITKQEDYRLRMKALNDNPDKVDLYFSERLQVLLKHVMPILGALYWIIRFEVQARGTIHAHLLIGVKGGPSKHDLEKARTKNDAYQKCTDDEK
ncbi:hypothetical protein ACOMHN_008174 [Nucella lapillus]